MKQIIPFKKDIIFKTNISDVTTISLEHDLSLRNSDLISGNFSITGKYKMTDVSANEENFSYDLPFDIAIDSRFDTKDVDIDIEDFNYEIINNEVLRVAIDISIDNLKEIPIEEVAEIKENIFDHEEVECPPEIIKENIFDIEPREEKEELQEEIEPPKEEEELRENIEENINTIFNYAKEKEETYSTYNVYIVRENDSLESILSRYDIDKDELAKYNINLELQIGDKLIIPAKDE